MEEYISYNEIIKTVEYYYKTFINSYKRYNTSIDAFKDSTYRIIDDIWLGIEESLIQKIMYITIITIKGFENNELVPEIEALIKELIQNNTLEQIKSEISLEDYELIKKDIEFIREKLKV